MIEKITEGISREDEYIEYLHNHIEGVKRSWNEILKPALLTESDLTVEELTEIEEVISVHDASKYQDAEFVPYLNYFYPTESNPKDEKAFDFAWNHHQKNNPHHWQYWILIRDEGEQVVQDMSTEYIFEMLCDWHSFSLKYPESTAYKWYHDNKDKMILSDATRKLVEQFVEYLKEPLEVLK